MKKILPIFFVGLLILSGIGASGFSQTKSITSNVDEYDMVIIAPNEFSSQIQSLIDHKDSHNVPTILKTTEDLNYLSVMRPNKETLDKWEKDYNTAELAFIDPDLNKVIQATSSYSILHHVNYIPEERAQGWCSNCWAWPATAILGIALDVQYGIFDRLSVQYINSCGEEETVFPKIECCEGGNLNMFAGFYKRTKIAIPWSNTNAHWQDDHAQCKTTCDSISKIPSYPIEEIKATTIALHGTPEEEVIFKIKNILHQERGVYFTIFYPDLSVIDDFRDMWQNHDEEYIYKLDQFCGTPYVSEEAAGHAVLIVGYNDPNPEIDDEDDYWVILNSWGTNSNRPNGLFRVDMHMNYDCKYDSQYAFGVQTLNITYTEDLEAPYPPEINGPNSGLPETPYTYTISAVDPQEDDVYFTIDWDDGAIDEWVGPYSSGEQIEFVHTWSKKGSYTIRVLAKDAGDHESFWSTLSISMPKTRDIHYSIIQMILTKLFTNHPILIKIINSF